ncbi:Spy/CpxP family protein refolding chaperone [Halomonas rhizosphaerae]|uniref:Spy/CpxP family protein refolding chaperone n=1 Tax=Halomonas rhizosphaerae TaxID=3043296 RepID=A0ABT6UV51_9GAMM|nr:Spy/CpxP family protein refolding chaperone [Halomonas rhizosphaerae]MDI5889571.1 Spy/CpxP family protein refolding chaperone [Halomonas rhizosphaerae]
MVKYKQFLAVVLAASMGIVASGTAAAQGMQQGAHGTGGTMMGGQGGMGPGMMMGGQGGMGPGMMMGGQGGMGPGMMMGGQGGMDPGMMMGGQGGMGPGMMMGGQGGMGPGMMMGGQGGMAGILDEEQLSSLREIRREHRSAHFERMGEMMNLRDDMMLLMQAERPDPEEVQALHGQMATLHGEMMADKVRMRNRMQDLLTDEQREQLKQGASSRKSPQ